ADRCKNPPRVIRGPHRSDRTYRIPREDPEQERNECENASWWSMAPPSSGYRPPVTHILRRCKQTVTAACAAPRIEVLPRDKGVSSLVLAQFPSSRGPYG